MRRSALLIFLTGCATYLFAQQVCPPTDSVYWDYIARYKEIVLQQENEYGIPAAITMAQALLESSAGQSELAINANNHFGIKCTSEWKWETYNHDDDARNECFRKYYAAEDSFIDHSLFLKRKRYAPLFELDIHDYQHWAQTLRQCGYATDPKYPDKLMDIIGRYRLDELKAEVNE
ncbi:MAG: glucosaminidase domain-containing protein [Paludibacteraceae bacterium]|nr:glucosaminidase domain-containing protein [Paludibacteraceae bacterium]